MAPFPACWLTTRSSGACARRLSCVRLENSGMTWWIKDRSPTLLSHITCWSMGFSELVRWRKAWGFSRRCLGKGAPLIPPLTAYSLRPFAAQVNWEISRDSLMWLFLVGELIIICGIFSLTSSLPRWTAAGVFSTGYHRSITLLRWAALSSVKSEWSNSDSSCKNWRDWVCCGILEKGLACRGLPISH